MIRDMITSELMPHTANTTLIQDSSSEPGLEMKLRLAALPPGSEVLGGGGFRLGRVRNLRQGVCHGGRVAGHCGNRFHDFSIHERVNNPKQTFAANI